MTAATLSDEAILASLKAHPGLRDRFASIIGAIENSEGNFKEADAPQSPNKSRAALDRDRFCGLGRVRGSRSRVAGHLPVFVVAHGESRGNRMQPERVLLVVIARGPSSPRQGTRPIMSFWRGNGRFGLIRPVHAPAPLSSGGRRGSSPALASPRPGE